MRLRKSNDVTGITEEVGSSEESFRDPDSGEITTDTDTEETKDPGKAEATEDMKDAEAQDGTKAPEDSEAAEEPAPGKEKGKNRKERNQPRKPVSTKRLAVSLLIKAGVILLVIWITFTFILGMTINRGNNMHPAINDGDLVISLRLQQPYLNAAVLYRRGGETVTGRVVGLAGNVIDISENGKLLVDGSVAAEDIFYPTQKAEGSDVKFPYTVEDGRAFILNDYRADTDDSRSFGAVDMKDIEGPVLFVMRRRGF